VIKTGKSFTEENIYIEGKLFVFYISDRVNKEVRNHPWAVNP
jgi:hypothetical protein